MVFLNAVLLENIKELVYSKFQTQIKIIIKWTKNLVDNTVKYCVKDESLIKRIQSYKLYIYERHFTPEQIYMYPTSKMLNEGALPALNLPRESASNTTKHRPTIQLRK